MKIRNVIKKKHSAILFILLCFTVHSSPVDSLKLKLMQESNKEQKLEIMADLIEAYQRISSDTALQIGNEALRLIDNDHFIPQLIRIQTNIATVYLNMGEYISADSLFSIALKNALRIKNMILAAGIYNNFGLSQSHQHKYDKAIKFYLESLHIADSLGVKETVVRTNVNIGVIYHYQNNHRMALDYHLKALNVIKKENIEFGAMYPVLLRNIGAFYQLIDNMDSAYYYTLKSLEISKKNNDKRGISICYQNLGDFFVETDPQRAEQHYIKSLELKRELKNMRGIAHTAASLGDLHYKSQQFNKAIEYLKESLMYSEKLGDHSLMSETYKILSDSYENINEANLALKYHKLYAVNKDSLTKKTNENKLLELQTQYETSLKEKQILELEHQQEISNVIIKNNRIVITISFVAIVIIILLLTIVFKAFLSIKKQRDTLREKNIIIEQQNDEITAQRDHLVKSNFQIQHQHKQIEDSIAYARQIQDSLLPSTTLLKKMFNFFSLCYFPKDIVSGDFYWIHYDNQYKYVAIGDCTGHGVPGAFMSVLSISLLNEVVKSKRIIEPADILTEMRSLVISSLKQSSENMGEIDGLELAICRIDIKSGNIVYAGAHRPIYLLRNNKIQEFQPDKMPISAWVRMNEFSQIEIMTQKNDIVVLFTDGFQDQFTGHGTERYGKQRFKNMIMQLSELNQNEQFELMLTEFLNWKGDGDQIDDVLVFCFKFL